MGHESLAGLRCAIGAGLDLDSCSRPARPAGSPCHHSCSRRSFASGPVTTAKQAGRHLKRLGAALDSLALWRFVCEITCLLIKRPTVRPAVTSGAFGSCPRRRPCGAGLLLCLECSGGACSSLQPAGCKQPSGPTHPRFKFIHGPMLRSKQVKEVQDYKRQKCTQPAGSRSRFKSCGQNSWTEGLWVAQVSAGRQAPKAI